jgi:hypothetical protein
MLFVSLMKCSTVFIYWSSLILLIRSLFVELSKLVIILVFDLTVILKEEDENTSMITNFDNSTKSDLISKISDDQ